MPGIFFPRGGQLRIPAGRLTIRMTEDGAVVGDPVTPQLRMDLWPQWLMEAIDAAAAMCATHDDLVADVVSLSDQRIGDLLDMELRTAMRTITSSAFAVDAFYASVRSRSSEHPDRRRWLAPGRRTPRHVQVFGTLHHALKIRRPGAGQMKDAIQELFKFRGWAVHADSAFQDPVLREDVDRGVDWHYAAFRTDNALAVLHKTLQMLDVLIELFDRGSDELREWKPAARGFMDEVLDRYDATPGLLALSRARDHAAARPTK